MGLFGKKEPKLSQADLMQKMISGKFDMNDMLTQVKQIKKMSNLGGLLKMVPGMKDAAATLKEKVANGELDRQISILEAMTPEERADPDKIFANAKLRIADAAKVSVRDVDMVIKAFEQMKRQMKNLPAMMQQMQNKPQ